MQIAQMRLCLKLTQPHSPKTTMHIRQMLRQRKSASTGRTQNSGRAANLTHEAMPSLLLKTVSFQNESDETPQGRMDGHAARDLSFFHHADGQIHLSLDHVATFVTLDSLDACINEVELDARLARLGEELRDLI